MGTIQNMINEPQRVLEEKVNWKGAEYTLRGAPDANLLAQTVMVSSQKAEQLARHWSNVTGSSFQDSIVKQVLLVHATLQPEDPAEPYDVVDIATLATKEAPFFLMLVKAAYDATGMTDKELFNQVVGGNSEEQAEDTN